MTLGQPNQPVKLNAKRLGFPHLQLKGPNSSKGDKPLRKFFSQWPEILERGKTKSLRQIAKEYGVSHEAIRRTLKAVTH